MNGDDLSDGEANSSRLASRVVTANDDEEPDASPENEDENMSDNEEKGKLFSKTFKVASQSDFDLFMRLV